VTDEEPAPHLRFAVPDVRTFEATLEDGAIDLGFTPKGSA
jgi:hypothetical protein